MPNFTFWETALSGVMRVHSQSYRDERGELSVSFDATVINNFQIKQVNYVVTKAGALRGLHYQLIQPQAKLVKVLSGHIYDVCVDLRKQSTSFGRWAGFELSSPADMLFVPHGIAHGFYALTDAVVMYFMDDFYNPDNERILYWDDPRLNIDWPLIDGLQPVISDRDRDAPCFDKADKFE